MADSSAVEIAVGDQVRVHYHPPGIRRSFVEGVVHRVDLTTLRGQGFVVDITSEVILGREQPIRPGYQSFVLYERRDDFPGRIEVLSQIEEPEHISGSASDPGSELEPVAGQQPEPESAPESEPDDDPAPRGLGRLLGAVIGRRACRSGRIDAMS